MSKLGGSPGDLMLLRPSEHGLEVNSVRDRRGAVPEFPPRLVLPRIFRTPMRRRLRLASSAADRVGACSCSISRTRRSYKTHGRAGLLLRRFPPHLDHRSFVLLRKVAHIPFRRHQPDIVTRL